MSYLDFILLLDSGYLSVGHSEMYPYDVLVTRRETEGFGFVIISSISKMGSVIGESIGTYPAAQCYHGYFFQSVAL